MGEPLTLLKTIHQSGRLLYHQSRKAFLSSLLWSPLILLLLLIGRRQYLLEKIESRIMEVIVKVPLDTDGESLFEEGGKRMALTMVYMSSLSFWYAPGFHADLVQTITPKVYRYWAWKVGTSPIVP